MSLNSDLMRLLMTVLIFSDINDCHHQCQNGGHCVVRASPIYCLSATPRALYDSYPSWYLHIFPKFSAIILMPFMASFFKSIYCQIKFRSYSYHTIGKTTLVWEILQLREITRISFFSGLGKFLPLCVHAGLYWSALRDRNLWMLQLPLSEWGHVSRTGSRLHLWMPGWLYRIQLPGTIIIPSSWLNLFCLRLIYMNHISQSNYLSLIFMNNISQSNCLRLLYINYISQSNTSVGLCCSCRLMLTHVTPTLAWMEPVVSMYKATTTVTALTTGRGDIVRTQSQPVCQGHVKVRQHSSSIFIGSLFLEKWVNG